MSKADSSPSFFDKIGPLLFLGTVVMAFIVGVLWQKVSSLENGKSGSPSQVGTGSAPTASVSPLSDLNALAKKAGVDGSEFKSCVSSKKYAARVESDYQEGVEAGVTGTPASFVVNNAGDVWFIPGAFPLADVKTTIDIAMGKGGTLPAQIVKLDASKAASVPKPKDTDHYLGKSSTGVYLIEYSDLQCPFCERYHPTTKQVLSDYEGQVALIFRHFPLDQIHPLARPAAEASECASEIGGNDAFWKFVDAVFEN